IQVSTGDIPIPIHHSGNEVPFLCKQLCYRYSTHQKVLNFVDWQESGHTRMRTGGYYLYQGGHPDGFHYPKSDIQVMTAKWARSQSPGPDKRHHCYHLWKPSNQI